MNQYWIRKSDGQEMGPVNEETVRQWIAQGFVFARTLARKSDSAEWQQLSDILGMESFQTAANVEHSPTPPAIQTPVQIQNAHNSPVLGTDETLAKWSRNLGITSLLLALCWIGFLLVLPAIITGHLALRRARRNPEKYGGEKNAKMGLICGYAGLLLLVSLVTVVIPAFKGARLVASAPYCLDHLKSIGAANVTWAGVHGKVFAPDFLTLSNQLRNPLLLVCPSLQDYPDWDENSDWTKLDQTWFSYQYPGAGRPTNSPASMVMVRCPRHSHVCFMDGHVLPGEKYKEQISHGPRTSRSTNR